MQNRGGNNNALVRRAAFGGQQAQQPRPQVIPVSRAPGMGGYGQPQQQQPPQHDQGMGSPNGYDFRRALGGHDSRLNELANQVAGLTEGLGSQNARVEDLVRLYSHPAARGLQDGGLGALGDAVQAAILTGRCLPYFASVEVFVPKGCSGEQLANQIFVSSDGPVFIAEMKAYAQIDSCDEDAEKYPQSLLKKAAIESCLTENCPTTGTFSADNAPTVEIKCSSLFPTIDARGRFIPISPKNCREICCGPVECCVETTCTPGGTPTQQTGFVPITLLDHPDCLDGVVEIFTNGCGWQNNAFPLAFFDEEFNIKQSQPNCIGICGYLDCNKVLQVTFTPTAAPRFDTNLTFVFAGFRAVTCGSGGCGVQT